MNQTRTVAKRLIELEEHEYQLFMALRRDFRPFDLVNVKIAYNQAGTVWSATIYKGYQDRENILLKIDVNGHIPASTSPKGE